VHSQGDAGAIGLNDGYGQGERVDGSGHPRVAGGSQEEQEEKQAYMHGAGILCSLSVQGRRSWAVARSRQLLQKNHGTECYRIAGVSYPIKLGREAGKGTQMKLPGKQKA